MKILVSGSSGFIGNRLSKALLDRGHDVTGFDLEQSPQSGYSTILGDLRSYEDVDKAVQRKEVIYHLGALANLNICREKPLETVQVNVLGTANVAKACQKHDAKLIYASSCHVYGHQNHFPVTEDNVPNPSEIYSATKLAGERIIQSFPGGVKHTILRYGTAYGPCMRPQLAIYIFLEKAMKNETITVFRPGTQTRQFIYIDDLIEGNILALERPEAEGQIINLPGSEGISILRLATLCVEIAKSRSEVNLGPPRPSDIALEFVSSEKANFLLNWKPKTDLKEGLKKTLNWMKSIKKRRIAINPSETRKQASNNLKCRKNEV